MKKKGIWLWKEPEFTKRTELIVQLTLPVLKEPQVIFVSYLCIKNSVLILEEENVLFRIMMQNLSLIHI